MLSFHSHVLSLERISARAAAVKGIAVWAVVYQGITSISR